jgi:hypothetical protein
MVDFDDILRCPACGSNDVNVEHPYIPGSGTTGKAYCLHCGVMFSFTWAEAPNLEEQ